MKKSLKKKRVIVSQKLYPSQINELEMLAVIIKKDKLDNILKFISNNGGRVISAIKCHGISHSALSEFIYGETYDYYFTLCMCQKEVADIFMLDLCREFKFNEKGNGKAFIIDILGYMGAKGPFVE